MIDQTPSPIAIERLMPPSGLSNCEVSITNSRKRASIIDGSCMRYASRMNGKFLNKILRRESVSVCFLFVLKKRELKNKISSGRRTRYTHTHTRHTLKHTNKQAHEMTRFKDWYKYSLIIFLCWINTKKGLRVCIAWCNFIYFSSKKLSLSHSKTNVFVCSLGYFVVGRGGRRETQMFSLF